MFRGGNVHDYAIHIPAWRIHTDDLAVPNYDHRKWLRERDLVSFKVFVKPFQELNRIDPRVLQVIGKAWISRDFRVVTACDSVLVLAEVADELSIQSSIRHVKKRRRIHWHAVEIDELLVDHVRYDTFHLDIFSRYVEGKWRRESGSQGCLLRSG
ncbi:hypothetical protein BDR03DRAFT_949369 [Suillus americanus]|nr:hypothetical protein BDR03DRAFT_949369 [Suillus americanus]